MSGTRSAGWKGKVVNDARTEFGRYQCGVTTQADEGSHHTGRRGGWCRGVRAAARFAQAEKGTPPSVITQPPRQWGPDTQPETYPDPDIIQLDPSFGPYMLGITAIHRLTTGLKWAEGPAWSAQGNFLLWSDVQGNIQYRMLWEDMRETNVHDNVRFTRYRDPNFLNNVATSVRSVMRPAGPEKATGIVSAGFVKDPTDPQGRTPSNTRNGCLDEEI